MRSVINQKRLDYAFELVRCADTVTLTTCAEVKAIVERALSGEFDADIFKDSNVKVSVTIG